MQIAQNYEGSEYQNQTPSKIDMKFYEFINSEISKHIKN